MFYIVNIMLFYFLCQIYLFINIKTNIIFSSISILYKYYIYLFINIKTNIYILFLLMTYLFVIENTNLYKYASLHYIINVTFSNWEIFEMGLKMGFSHHTPQKNNVTIRSNYFSCAIIK